MDANTRIPEWETEAGNAGRDGDVGTAESVGVAEKGGATGGGMGFEGMEAMAAAGPAADDARYLALEMADDPGMALARLIGLPDEAIARLGDADLGRVNGLASLMDGLAVPATAKAAWATLKQAVDPDPDGWRMLRAMLAAAATRTAAGYRRDGIGWNVFLATMGAFARFTGESVPRHGRLLFDRDFWTWRQLAGTLVRLGSLEYEHATVAIGGVPSETGLGEAINVHIPSDASLAAVDMDASLAAWDAFAARYRPQWRGLPLVCESWLLSPVLPELLTEDSHILAFQRRFDLIADRPDAPDWREWIFDTNPAPVTDLPERTGLQCAAKRHLLAGGMIGVGIGVLRR